MTHRKTSRRFVQGLLALCIMIVAGLALQVHAQEQVRPPRAAPVGGAAKAPMAVDVVSEAPGEGGAAAPIPAAAQGDRAKGDQLMKQGNWKEAYAQFKALVLDAKTEGDTAGQDLSKAIQCLRNLGNVSEADTLIESGLKAHPKSWHFLHAAAQQYLSIDQYGFIIAGEFVRGGHRGGGRQVFTAERDRVRALQILQDALPLVAQEKNGVAAGGFYQQLAQVVLGNRGYSEAWRLQYLTDITKLPDYDESAPGGWGMRGRGVWHGGGEDKGAPVDADGNPVFHTMPKTWQDAQSDGQRWRWAIMQTMEANPALRDSVRFEFATFLRNQFDVQTMAYLGYFGRGADATDDKVDKPGPFAVKTLGEDETIARLATGAKRFKLPDEFNFIRIFQDIAGNVKGDRAWQATEMLAQIFEDRQQYPKAAVYWKQALTNFGDPHKTRQNRLDQIVKEWGTFEMVMTQPAGAGATVDFRYRNAKSVSLDAVEIDVPKLIADMKEYLKAKPGQLDWQKFNISDLGYRLVQENQQQYLKGKVAEWKLDLKPRENHFDRRVTIETPLKKPGAYLVTAKLENGNISRVIMWVADTAIVKRQMEKQGYVYVADAITGTPVAKANVEFFGFRQRWINNAGGQRPQIQLDTMDFAEFTDADGQVFLKNKEQQNEFQWVVIATTPAAEGGRFAYWGFTGIWGPDRYDAVYEAVKPFLITDRPVYRPEQPIKFKFWVAQAKYDQQGPSPFAGRDVKVLIHNPKGEKVYEKMYKLDEYGGLDGEFITKKDDTLGVYQIMTEQFGGGSFRLEEYKKPEFEVSIDAPKEPVMLGEKIAATVKAKYLFGAPVQDAKVSYKVLRTSYDVVWYPWGRWDWFYGRGYWWFGCDYGWYPGWYDWGCKRPGYLWWPGWHQPQPPEVVAEGEAKINADGTFAIQIDTALAKEVHGDKDHRYEVTAEVTDASRRTIVGTGAVLVARKPFKVTAWVDRGHYRAGDVIQAQFNAQTLDSKPVPGKGELRLLRVSYDKDMKPSEKEVQKWNLDTDEQGQAQLQIKAAEGGQYRLSYKLTDVKKHTIEGGYVFTVAGNGFNNGADFRFNDIELISDKREYKPGEKVALQVNTNRKDSTVLLFVRPTNGVYLPPKVLRLKGKSTQEAIEVVMRDMPNFYVEALTISDARVYTEIREVIVPPESRVLDVKITPSAEKYKPGEKAKVKVKLTEPNGEPFVGSTVVSVYDKAVEYISGGSNVPEIKEYFWKWRRSHYPSHESSLSRAGYNILKNGEIPMNVLGVFGHMVADLDERKETERAAGFGGGGGMQMKNAARGRAMPAAAPMAMRAAKSEMAEGAMADAAADRDGLAMAGAAPGEEGGDGTPAMAAATVRTKFADTALWVASLTTNKNGEAEVELTMPENLTTWKTKVWAMGNGTRVGEGSVEVVTTKNLIIRLQAPRFFVEKDEVVLSANVHNYLKDKKSVKVVLETDGPVLAALPGTKLTQTIDVDANGEKRVDWRVKVAAEGHAVVRMKALTNEESDAMEMKFPAYVHGMLKTDSFSGVIKPDQQVGTLTMKVPKERRPDESRLEVRYSPTLAGAMVDALPYLVDYPYGCTEQTLNRFLPTVITQNTLLRMGLDLKDIQKKRTNLNAQEIGDDVKRAADWQRMRNATRHLPDEDKNPVFDVEVVKDMVKTGVARLTAMQNGDGGWGWFSGWGEHSWPHTTAYVVHGLQIAKDNDVALVPGTLERGVEWLKRYQAEQVQLIKNAEKAENDKNIRRKSRADDLDAFVFMVLVDAKVANQDMKDMQEFLYRDRNFLAVYTKAMFGLALHKLGVNERRDMLLRNVEQFLVLDDENQTAFLKLPENNYWWCWYGSEYEAHAYYLKLLAAVDPKGDKASRIVKYLVNNRKNSTYWNSTRDTAVCVEAFADFIKASGEETPDMTVEVLVDGKKMKEVKIDKTTLFSFDNKVVLVGKDVTDGEHKVELRRKGQGRLYFNAYLTNFTLEDFITKAGLEVKVNRKYYLLTAVDKKIKAQGARGQVLDQKVEKYERKELPNLSKLKSGDLVEIELEIDSKNDYEYLMFEDMKAAGFEPMEVRSGYNANDMGAYMELRDERVCFFVRALARGKHSVAYRMRAEIPGTFSALPTKASAMYAPELKANSDEIKLSITD